MLKKWRKTFTTDHNIYSIALIIIGTISWSLTMIKSGLNYSYGMGFWGPNGHDGVWHIALTNSLAKGSWDMPIFAGEVLKNYHIGYDLILAMIHKLSLIPIHNLYFQVAPPILALLVGLLAYKLVIVWKHSSQMALWSTFFIYFGGSFGWIITLLRNGDIGGESMFWSQQSVSTLINPPFALSLVVIFAGLLLLTNLKGSKNKRRLFFASLVFGLLVQIKAYAGVLVLGGLFTAGLFEIAKHRRFFLFKVFAGSLIVSLLVFLPLNDISSNLLEYKPFWFLEGMMGYPDRLNWFRYYSAMTNYIAGGVWHKAILAYIGAFMIFVIGNMGLRILGFIEWFALLKHPKKTSWIDVFLISIIMAGILIPMFFVQKGNPWNMIQFFYYSLIFMGIYSGVFMGRNLKKLVKKSKSTHIKISLIALVVLVTIPTTLSTLWFHYLPTRPPAMINKEELEALRFLSKLPSGVVLTLPFDKDKANAALDNPPRPLYLYESTAYVSAFSDKTTYLEDELNLEITDYNWRERREEVEGFLSTPSQVEAREYLKKEGIDYIYWNKKLFGEVVGGRGVMEQIFENDVITIYQVR